jgi:hypothetical protein
MVASKKLILLYPSSQRRLILRLLNTLHTPKPINPTLAPNLHSGLKLRIVQAQVINRTHSRKRKPREPRASSIHQRSTDLAEKVCHCVAGSHGFGGRVLG